MNGSWTRTRELGRAALVVLGCATVVSVVVRQGGYVVDHGYSAWARRPISAGDFVLTLGVGIAVAVVVAALAVDAYQVVVRQRRRAPE